MKGDFRMVLLCKLAIFFNRLKEKYYYTKCFIQRKEYKEKRMCDGLIYCCSYVRLSCADCPYNENGETDEHA